MEKIDKELEIFQKNIDALFDMTGLIFTLRTKLSPDAVPATTLFRRVLKNLCDSEVKIGYKGGFLDHYLPMRAQAEHWGKVYGKQLSRQIAAMIFECYDYPNLAKGYDQPAYQSYNLIKEFVQKNYFQGIQELLASDIPIEIRAQMLDDFFSYTGIYHENILSSRYCPAVVWAEGQIYPEASEAHYDRIRLLLQYWKESKQYTNEISMLGRMIIENPTFPALNFFSEYDLIDFNKNCRFIATDYGEVGAPAAIYHYSQKNFGMMSTLYEMPSYSELPEEVKERTDLMLIHCLDRNALLKFLGLSNFQLSEEKIDCLSNRILKYSMRGITFPEYFEQIKEIISNKVDSNEDQGKLQFYSSLLQEKVDQQLDTSRHCAILQLAGIAHRAKEQTLSSDTKIKQLTFSKTKSSVRK